MIPLILFMTLPYLHFQWQDSLILYARLQLNLTRGAADESLLLEQLMDVLGKELDQTHTSSTSALR